MDNNQIRNFYEEEQKYEESIISMKKNIEMVININFENFKEKINHVDKDNKYEEFIDLFEAVLGKETNNYYYCQDEDDVKYYNLILGEVYRINKLNIELQSKNNLPKSLNLQARSKLAQKLLPLTIELKQDYIANLGKSDGSLATFESYIIREQDINYLYNFIKYLETLIDKTGRLKVLVAEKDVYALKKAQDQYDKKSSVEKWLYKKFNKENKIIENLTEKYKAKK